VAEVEPNDFQHAQEIELPAAVHGNLSAPRDDDYFRLAPGSDVSLRVELAQADATLEVLDAERARLVRVRGGSIPAVSCRGSCFVHVSGRGPQPYTLSLAAEPLRPDRELEPNDRMEEAQALVPGTPLTGSFLSGEDRDWYRVALPAEPGRLLRVELSAAGRPELEVRGTDGAVLAAFRAREGDGIFMRDLSLTLADRDAGTGVGDGGASDGGVGDGGATDDAGLAAGAEAGPAAAEAGAAAAEAGPAAGAEAGPAAAEAGAAAVEAGPASVPQDAGTPAADGGPAGPPAELAYFLVLHRGTPGTPYRLAVSLESAPADLEQEPNDDPTRATPLGASASGYLSPKGDQDWYRVHASDPSVLQAELTGLGDIEVAAFEVPDGGKPRLLARIAEDGGTQSLPFVAIGPGNDGYLRVRRRTDVDDRDHLYHLSAKLLPDDGTVEREPNDTVASAQILSLPIDVTGHLWPSRDVDVFRFTVLPGHAPVSMILQPPRGMALSLRLLELHGEASEVIGASSARAPSLLSVPLKPGDYAVEVSSPHKDASATDAYELRISP
jgi:hypothetical protein